MIKQELLNNIPPRTNIIGVPISAVNMNSCITFLLDNRDAVRGNYICVSNVHTTVMAHDNPDYLKIQSDSLLAVPDGKPLSVLGKKRFSDMDRVTGPDLMRRIFEESRTTELRHYFYGTSKDNLEALIDKIKNDYPWVNIVGYEPSVFRQLSALEENELIERINSADTDILWVALGAPRQEEFCSKMEGKINSLMVGVGGAFNVVSGVIDEAPQWVQNISMEWLYRLLKEPKRLFKRYLITNSKFIGFLIIEKLMQRH